MLQVGGKKNMHGSLVIIEHVWNPLNTNFHFPKMMVRIQYTLAGETLTYVATATYEMLHIHTRTDFTYSMSHSSVVDVGALMQETSSVSSQPFLALNNQANTFM